MPTLTTSRPLLRPPLQPPRAAARHGAAMAAVLAAAMLFCSGGIAAGRNAPTDDPRGAPIDELRDSPAGDLQASLRATLAVSGLDGSPLAEVRRGEPFRLEVTLSDAATPAPPKGIRLAGWLRARSAGQPACREAARAFRVTRRLSHDAIDLNGILVVQLNTDGSLGVIDPLLDLRSSNMVAATRFDGQPDALAIDSRRQLALASFADRGEVVAVSLLDGRRQVFAQGLARPGQIVVQASGQVWVVEQSPAALVRLGSDGRLLDRLPLGAGEYRVLDGADRLIAWTPAGRIIVVETAASASEAGAVGAAGAAAATEPTAMEGLRISRFETGEPVLAAALAGEGAFVTLAEDGRRAAIRFLDAPARATEVPLRAGATAIAADPGGAHAFAWSSEHGGVSVIDIATARQVTGFAADRPIGEAAFSPGLARFLADDQSLVLTLDLASVGLGREPAIRAMPLGAPRQPGRAAEPASMPATTTGAAATAATATGPAPRAPARHLVPLPPTARALAIRPASGTAFVVDDMPAIGSAPPMNSVRLRGGRAQSVFVLDRSFRELSPGRFATHARIDRPGAHELVLTTGIGGMTVCLPVAVDGGDAGEPAPIALVMRVSAGPVGGEAIQPAVPLRAGVAQRLVVDLRDRDGRAYGVDQLALAIPSLDSAWSTRTTARRNGDGALEAELTLPHPGTYAVQALLPPRSRASVAPATLIVR